jgi:hypothetical protein
MKRFCLILALGTLAFAANAQKETTLRPFKVDVSLGYASPGGTGAKGGVLFAIEPKYAVMPSLSLGLRMEGAVVARFSGYDSEGNPNDASVKAAGSYVVTGDYYMMSNYKFRPFVGTGAGIFSIAGVEINQTTGGASAQSKFGGIVRTGFETGHFRLGIEYNIVPQTEFQGFDNNGDPATLKSKNGYIGVKLGVVIGGGPR